MDQQKVLIAICGMTFVTYVPRLMPALLLSGARLPQGLTRWLRFVPVAVLSTLVMPGLLLTADDHHLNLSGNNLHLLAAVPTALFAFATRSFMGTVILGVAVTAALRVYQTL